jgi:2-iminobutanoate/2-iminopropanoate deaminase
MTITAIDPPGLPRSPVFAGGMLTTGGSIVWIGGQNGFGADGVIADDLATESRLATENLLAVITEAGGTIEHLVSVTIHFVAGTDLNAAFAGAGPVLAGHRCSVIALGVAALARPDAHLEISGIGVVPDPRP